MFESRDKESQGLNFDWFLERMRGGKVEDWVDYSVTLIHPRRTACSRRSIAA